MHRVAIWGVLLVTSVTAFVVHPAACQSDRPAGRTFTLPTGLPSGNAVNDRIWVTFYPAEHVVGPAPAVILLHPLAEVRNRIMDRFARHLASRGIAGAAVVLPYHMQRLARGENPLNRFVGTDIDRVEAALE